MDKKIARCILYDCKYQRHADRRNAWIPHLCAIAGELMAPLFPDDKPFNNDPAALKDLIRESDNVLADMIADGRMHYRMLVDSERSLAEKERRDAQPREREDDGHA